MDQQTEKNLLALVKRNYEEIAADFDETRKNCSWPELTELTGAVKDGDRVLDAGCGNGRLLQMFGEKKISYLGVDSSKELIKIAKGNKEAGIRNQKFLVGDILELDKVSEKDFAYVFCIAVLHHLPGENLRVAALKQMKEKINENGKIIITAWNLWQRRKFRRLILKYAWLKVLGKNKFDFGDILFDWKNNLGQPISRRYYHAFTKNELKKIFRRAGLKPEKLYKDKYNYYAILKK